MTPTRHDETEPVIGLPASEGPAKLPHSKDAVVVHRENMVLLD